MKHLPFDSIYRQEFEVVEQRQGNTRLYPHTDQLPLLLRALNLEFYSGLPPRLARADQRADGLTKVTLRMAAQMFCNFVNVGRQDELRLFEVFTADLVAKVAILQQITVETRRGLCHWFKFYAGEDSFLEIRLSGKRVVFADHVLQRFTARTSARQFDDLSTLLLVFFGMPTVAMKTGPGRAFTASYFGSILAFPYKESADEFFITTCLSLHEIHSLEVDLPPYTANPHYDTVTFNEPKIRNWLPLRLMLDHYNAWERKVPQPPPAPAFAKHRWHRVASFVPDIVRKQGHGPGSSIVFLDRIHGPCVLEVKPGQVEAQFDEWKIFRETHPDVDWDEELAERERERAEINQRTEPA